MSKPKRKQTIPNKHILLAIHRCEQGINPAVIDAGKFAVHCRRQVGDLVEKAWFIRVIDKADVDRVERVSRTAY